MKAFVNSVHKTSIRKHRWSRNI